MYEPQLDDIYEHGTFDRPKYRKIYFLCVFLTSLLVLATITTAVLVIVIVYYAKMPGWAHTPQYWESKDTLIVITVDGFRSDYLTVVQPECYNIITKLINGGISTNRGGVYANLYPVFPAKPATNLATLVTGTYPSYHGILNKNVSCKQV
jgi:predicted AlkP superfamily pyrophosphatase or phosphodiesterase